MKEPNKTNKIIIVFSLIFFSLLLFDKWSEPTLWIESKKTITINMEITEIQMLDFINQKFAEAHNYTENYQCLNYSKDYNTLMQLLGYDTSQYIGCNQTNCHAWNKLTLEIEPSTGKIRKNKDIYYLEYK